MRPASSLSDIDAEWCAVEVPASAWVTHNCVLSGSSHDSCSGSPAGSEVAHHVTVR